MQKTPNLTHWPCELGGDKSGLLELQITDYPWAVPRTAPDRGIGLRIKRPKPGLSSALGSTPLPLVASTPPLPSPAPKAPLVLPPFLQNLLELLDLEGSGEKVVWPPGFTALCARDAIDSYVLADPSAGPRG